MILLFVCLCVFACGVVAVCDLIMLNDTFTSDQNQHLFVSLLNYIVFSYEFLWLKHVHSNNFSVSISLHNWRARNREKMSFFFVLLSSTIRYFGIFTDVLFRFITLSLCRRCVCATIHVSSGKFTFLSPSRALGVLFSLPLVVRISDNLSNLLTICTTSWVAYFHLMLAFCIIKHENGEMKSQGILKWRNAYSSIYKANTSFALR